MDVARVNSRKHIKCINNDDGTFQFIVYQLIKLRDVIGYRYINLLKIYKDDLLVSKHFGLSKESINLFAAYANVDLPAYRSKFNLGINIQTELNKLNTNGKSNTWIN